MAKKTTSLEFYRSFREEIRSSSVKPVYAFFGEETFFIDRLQEAAIEVVPEASRDFNLDVLYGLDVKVNSVVDICRSYPMMAERRVVIVRDFMKMFSEKGGENAESATALSAESGEKNVSGEISLDDASSSRGGQEDLAAYLKQPNPATVLFLTNETRPSQHSSVGKALKKSKVVTSHTFEAIPDYMLQQWITEWAASEYNMQFEDSAAQLLAFHVGANLQQLTVEIEKLSNYREDKGAIENEDVRQVVGLSREYSLFEFQDALLEKNREKTMVIAHQILRMADNATGEIFKMIGFLYSTFGKIWLIQRLSQKGLTPDQIKKQTGINSKFYYEKLVRAGRNYSLGDFPMMFEILLDADKALKGFSRESPEAIWLMTIKKLTN